MEELLRDLKGRHRLGKLRYPLEDEPDGESEEVEAGTNRPCIRIESVIGTTERLEVQVRYGREGDFDLAIHQNGSHTSLTDAATTREFTVLFYFPTNGAAAIMVAETRGRTHVGETLLHLLSIASKERQQAGAGYKLDGDKRVTSGWVRWAAHVMTDSQRLDEVLRHGEKPEIKLVKYHADKGGIRGSNTLTLTQNGLKYSDIDSLKDKILGWVGMDGSKEAKRRRAAADLQAFLDDEVSVGGEGFTDGEVKFLEDGKVQTITATNMDRLLVYPTGEDRMSPDQLAKVAVERARQLAALAKLPIDFGIDVRQ